MWCVVFLCVCTCGVVCGCVHVCEWWWRVWCGEAWHAENTPVCTFKTPPCVRSGRLRVYRQRARMSKTCSLLSLLLSLSSFFSLLFSFLSFLFLLLFFCSCSCSFFLFLFLFPFYSLFSSLPFTPTNTVQSTDQHVNVIWRTTGAQQSVLSPPPLNSLLPSLPLLLLKTSRDLEITGIFPARNLFLLQFKINSKKSPPGEITSVTVLY